MQPRVQPVSAANLLARLEAAPFTSWHARARVVMGSATFFDAFSALSLAFALPVLVAAWHITPQQSGLLIGAAYVGQLAGAFLFSWLAEKYGRVRSAAIAVAIIAVMSLACSLANTFAALVVCRIVQGIGIGGEMPVAAAYISELSPARSRGKFFLLYEMIFPIGLMAAGQAGAWAVPELGWQSIFLIGGVPCIVVALLVARLPESPRWLLSKGRVEEAEAIVRQMEARILGPIPSVSETPEAASVQPTRWGEVLSENYRKRTLVIWALWFSAYIVANSLNNWLPTLYNTVYHLALRQSLRAASLTNVTQVAILLGCAFLIDRIGRKNWTLASFAVAAVCLAIVAITGARSVTTVMILATLSYGVIGSANAVLYLYTPEVYPTRMRAIGTGLATAWLRVASAMGPAIVGALVSAGGVGSVFWMFTAGAVAGAFSALGMIETRGRRLEQIAK